MSRKTTWKKGGRFLAQDAGNAAGGQAEKPIVRGRIVRLGVWKYEGTAAAQCEETLLFRWLGGWRELHRVGEVDSAAKPCPLPAT